MADDEDGDYLDPMYAAFAEDYKRALEAGRSPTDAWELATAVLTRSLEESPSLLAADLVRRAPEMLRDPRQVREGFERRLREHWGEALDLFYMVAICVEEAAGEFDRRYTAASVAREDHLFDALTGTMARACRVSREVHHLLQGGYPFGALARSRTMMDLSVVSTILANYSRRPGFADIAERYRLHGVVRAYNEAKTYRETSDAQSLFPISDADFAALKAERDLLLARFGQHFSAVNGWASGVANQPEPSDRDLRQAADLVTSERLTTAGRRTRHTLGHADGR